MNDIRVCLLMFALALVLGVSFLLDPTGANDIAGWEVILTSGIWLFFAWGTVEVKRVWACRRAEEAVMLAEMKKEFLKAVWPPV